jgi:UDP-3-O-[3-hydroxymyristoyl] glucosamine N-acyltransferase
VTGSGKSLFELAEHVEGKVVGDGAVVIRGVAPLEEAQSGDITLYADPRYRKHLAPCGASAIIVGPGGASRAGSKSGRSYLEAHRPYVAFAKILNLFNPAPVYDGRISPCAEVESTAVLGEGTTVFPHVYIGKHARVGRGTALLPGVFLGDHVVVGERCVLHPHVVVGERCRIGSRVILHAGVVIGSDGFGYADAGGNLVKVPQVGIVEIGDDVEIGANTTVDRATLGRTVIGAGTKIDNLVQIAHNVVVGNGVLIAAQVGVAGSVRIGDRAILAGQAGVVDHVEIGGGTKVGPQSGVLRSVPRGVVVSSGLEAVPHREWRKIIVMLPRLGEMWRRLKRLEAGGRTSSTRGKKKGAQRHARR